MGTAAFILAISLLAVACQGFVSPPHSFASSQTWRSVERNNAPIIIGHPSRPAAMIQQRNLCTCRLHMGTQMMPLASSQLGAWLITEARAMMELWRLPIRWPIVLVVAVCSAVLFAGSLGNTLIEGDTEKLYDVYRNLALVAIYSRRISDLPLQPFRWLATKIPKVNLWLDKWYAMFQKQPGESPVAPMDQYDGAPPVMRFLTGFFAAPILEELLFRAVIFQSLEFLVQLSPLRTVLKYKLSAFCSSLLFGLIHLSNWIDMSLLTENTADWYKEETQDFVRYSIVSATKHAIATFSFAWFIFAPIYYMHGLLAAIGAHAATNAQASGRRRLGGDRRRPEDRQLYLKDKLEKAKQQLNELK